MTDSQTRPMAVDALKWAAYTYVIAAVGSLATLLYYIGIARSVGSRPDTTYTALRPLLSVKYLLNPKSQDQFFLKSLFFGA